MVPGPSRREAPPVISASWPETRRTARAGPSPPLSDIDATGWRTCPDEIPLRVADPGPGLVRHRVGRADADRPRLGHAAVALLRPRGPPARPAGAGLGLGRPG